MYVPAEFGHSFILFFNFDGSYILYCTTYVHKYGFPIPVIAVPPPRVLHWHVLADRHEVPVHLDVKWTAEGLLAGEGKGDRLHEANGLVVVQDLEHMATLDGAISLPCNPYESFN